MKQVMGLADKIASPKIYLTDAEVSWAEGIVCFEKMMQDADTGGKSKEGQE